MQEKLLDEDLEGLLPVGNNLEEKMDNAIFINHTNHPSARWSEQQKKAAFVYGEIKDIPFPLIPPEESSENIRELAIKMAKTIADMNPKAVLCQGEFNYVFCLVDALLSQGIKVMAACSERIVREWTDENGEQHRDAVFQFQQYRDYIRAKK